MPKEKNNELSSDRLEGIRVLWKANAQKCKSCLVRRLSEALNAVDVDVGEPDVPGDVWPEEDVVGREVPGDHDFKPGVSPSHPQRRLNRDQLRRLVHVQNVSAKENREFLLNLIQIYKACSFPHFSWITRNAPN